MKQTAYEKTFDWLKTNPPLEDICARYPEDMGRGAAGYFRHRRARQRGRAKDLSGASVRTIARPRSRIAHQHVKKLCLSLLATDAGVTKGKLRFNLLNGYIAQKLLFSGGLVRKPVSLFWFRLFWPLLWQKKRLMPLVQPHGIYCFYSRALVEALAKMIAARNCLEIGAGDGTLTRFLKDSGVNLTATDNRGWENAVKYPEWVIKLDAREALTTYTPEVDICSWPPSQNDFERHVLDTPSVQLYIVIGNRHQFAFGNWQDYRSQSAFDFEEDKTLGKLVLPPELESAFYVFRRKPQPQVR